MAFLGTSGFPSAVAVELVLPSPTRVSVVDLSDRVVAVEETEILSDSAGMVRVS